MKIPSTIYLLMGDTCGEVQWGTERQSEHDVEYVRVVKAEVDFEKFLDEQDSFLEQGKGIVRGNFPKGSIGYRKIQSLVQLANEQGRAEGLNAAIAKCRKELINLEGEWRETHDLIVRSCIEAIQQLQPSDTGSISDDAIDALRKDAERYRWIKTNLLPDKFYQSEYTQKRVRAFEIGGTCGSDIDADIDQAMKGGK